MSGIIPTSMGKMSSLVGLFLENNQFSGSIPESLYQLKALKQLELDHNMLSGVLPEMLSWMNLETLHVNNNRLEGVVPNGFGKNMTISMVSLFLNNNNFVGPIPLSFEKYACQLENQSQSIQCFMGMNNFTMNDCVENPCAAQRCGMKCGQYII